MRLRRFVRFASAVCVAVLLAVLTVIAGLRSDWFKERVRHRIVSTIEQVTGGRAELRTFNYHWSSLTAELDGFTLHGTEAATAPPLVRANKIVIGFKIVSLWKRNVDLSSLVVDHCQAFFTFDSKGNSNLPVPAAGAIDLKQAVDQLLGLKIAHFEFIDGAVQADARFIPLDARGENLQLLLNYEPLKRAYVAHLTSKQLRVTSTRFRPFSARLDADAELASNRLVVQHIQLENDKSRVDASGRIVDFRNPVADVSLNAKVAATDLAYASDWKGVRGGALSFRGTVHHDPSQPFNITGFVEGRDLKAELAGRLLDGVNIAADVQASNQGLLLRQLKAAAYGSRLAGEASLNKAGEFAFTGNVEGADSLRLSTLAFQRALPWSGLVSGPLHLRGQIRNPQQSLEAKGDLRINKGPGAIPLSGNLDFSYRAAGNVVEFGSSEIDLPQTSVKFSGPLSGDLQVAFDSTNLNDLKPALNQPLPFVLANGSAHFDGTVSRAQTDPRVNGNLNLHNFLVQGQRFDSLHARINASQEKLAFTGLSVMAPSVQATADGQIALTRWSLSQNGQLQVRTKFKGVDVAAIGRQVSAVDLPFVFGTASGSLDISGSPLNPSGSGSIHLENADAYGQRLNQIQMSVRLNGNDLQISGGRLEAGAAIVLFEGGFKHDAGTWQQGQANLRIDSNGFPISSMATVRRYDPGLSAKVQMHGRASVRIAPGHIEPLAADGSVVLTNVSQDGVAYGSFAVNAQTKGQELDASVSGDVRGSHIQGRAQIDLTAGNPASGELQVGTMQLATLYGLLRPGQVETLPFTGSVSGVISFSGPLQDPQRMRARAELDDLLVNSHVEVSPQSGPPPRDLVFRGVGPIVVAVADGAASVESFHVAGPDTTLTVNGSIPLLGQRPMDVRAAGQVDLRAVSLLFPEMQSSGKSELSASLSGTPEHPIVQGSLDVRNGSFFMGNFPAGLTDVNGTVRFDRDRATIQKLTGHSGGGQIAMTGFLSYHAGGPVIYSLEANAENVRFRYGGGVSVTANSDLRLTGTSVASVLSGAVAVSKIGFNPTADVGNLLASVSVPVPSPSNQKDFVSGLQMDVHVESAPDLQLSTALSRDLEAEIDLRLRGRPGNPSLLGSITAGQGDIRVFGTKYTINRADVNFLNPAKIEPVLDLDLQTEARGITVDITVSGAPNKLNINYRSDPPLQPRDIIALLTVGRAPDIASSVPNAQVTNDVSGLQTGANTVLGQAIAPVSNRLSKLFGITNIKIDPLVQGITNTPQARLTVEQQISPDITVTYITNLQQTSEQIFRFEWALSSRYSLVALRDDNGEFGMDIQYKRRFK